MNCKNCDGLISLSISYCPNCGAKIIRNRLTIKNLFGSFVAQFLNYDNKFFQTFINLFRKPEDVIGSYINGTRKKYVNVISYFAIAITVAGFQMFFINKFFPEALDTSFMESWPGQKGQAEFQKKNLSFTQEYQSILMMLYVPIYALMGKITFLGIKKFNYTELLVVFMYTQAQTSIAGAIIAIVAIFLGANFLMLGFLMIPLMIFYSAFCLKRLYNMEIGAFLIRCLLFFAILFIAFLILGIIMAVLMFINGDMQSAFEAGKAASGG